jgi:hypothetical protein
MTYDTRRSQSGQEYIQEIELVCDACKFVADIDYINNSFATNVPPISDTYTGVLALGFSNAYPQWASVSDYYIVVTDSGEVIKVSGLIPGEVTILERGCFGTTPLPLTPSGSELRFKHAGEVDGSCRGFPFTCSNTDSYHVDAKKRLIFSTGNNAGGLLRFAGLRKVSHDAGEVDPGESIGTRAQLKVDISNGTHNDYGIVPYPDKQTYSGTMFGKLLARHPYFQGREVIYREGFRNANTFEAPDLLERKFLIDSVNLSSEMFSITALDPIILTEDKKAQMPVASPAVLVSGINGATTAFSYTNAANYYFGAMAATIYIRIDSEIIQATVTGATQLTVSARGVRSTQKDHDAGASIQDCVVFDGTNGVDAIVYSLENYTRIPATYIGDYSAVAALLPSFVLDMAIISKPMAVAEFINYMVQLGNLVFYYDEVAQKIAIEYTPELEIEPITVSQQTDIKRDSVSVDSNLKNQFTRLAYLFAPVDVTKESEENYAIRLLSANVSLESDEYLGQVNEKKAVKNPLLTNSPGDSLLVSSYIGRFLQNNSGIPKIITATIDASKIGNNSGGELSVGSIVSLSTKYNEDKDGNPLSELYQVLKISGDGFKGYKTKFRRYQSIEPSSVDFVISAGGINYDLSNFFSPAAGVYTIYINSDVEFGSLDTSLPAFTTGSQSPGVSFKIINRGRMLGMGGSGGDSGIYPAFNDAHDGFDGGVSFETTVPVVIDTGSGLIWAGGGGGGGDDQAFFYNGSDTIELGAEGGGGGQGYGDSLGGLGTYGGDDTTHSAYDHRSASGNQSGPGIRGGAWGEDGQTGNANGGLAGIAIKTNGNSVTIIAGNNDLNIKGRRV